MLLYLMLRDIKNAILALVVFILKMVFVATVMLAPVVIPELLYKWIME